MKELDIFDSIQLADYDEALSTGMITLIGAETDEKFLANVMAQVNDPESVRKVADEFAIIFTPFHGTGYKLIPEALKRMGMKHVICVPEQMVIDGNFPTVASPNPENPEGFAIAVKMAKEQNISFIMGSDPDADRIGIMVRDKSGEFITITGNQNGVILLDYLIGAMKRVNKMPEKPVVLKSIVSTEMARAVAQANGVQCYDTFTGFKFLAEKKNQLEESGQGKVIMAFEESYGYMFGDYVRDKDAVTAALILAEAACYYATQGKTMYDALQDCYAKYGYYREKTINLVMPGLDGMAKMKEIMANLRQNPSTRWLESKLWSRRTISPVPFTTPSPVKTALWSSPVPMCCAMSWRTAPALSSAPPARSQRSRSTSSAATPPRRRPTPKWQNMLTLRRPLKIEKIDLMQIKSSRPPHHLVRGPVLIFQRECTCLR